MGTWLIVIAIILVLAALIGVCVRRELGMLQATVYTAASEKIAKEKTVTVLFLSDLHERTYGENNERLIALIRAQKPDVIVTGGDMLTCSSHTDFAKSRALYQALLQTAPVFAAYGNHEKRLSLSAHPLSQDFAAYQKALAEDGVKWLLNSGDALDESIFFYGLDTDFSYYQKLIRKTYLPAQMQQDLAYTSRECFNILLAHNPRFFETYAASGADLVLAGHYHGGAVRIGKAGLVSPQFRLFPRYSKGRFQKGNTTMVVTGGCGSHKVNLRLFNPPEVVVIRLCGKDTKNEENKTVTE